MLKLAYQVVVLMTSVVPFALTGNLWLLLLPPFMLFTFMKGMA